MAQDEMKHLLNKLIDDCESISKNAYRLNKKVDDGLNDLSAKLNNFRVKYAEESTTVSKDVEVLIKSAKSDMKIWGLISNVLTMLISFAIVYVKK